MWNDDAWEDNSFKGTLLVDEYVIEVDDDVPCILLNDTTYIIELEDTNLETWR